MIRDCVIVETKIDDYMRCSLVYVSHQNRLLALLNIIFLIDAKLVCPYDQLTPLA